MPFKKLRSRARPSTSRKSSPSPTSASAPSTEASSRDSRPEADRVYCGEAQEARPVPLALDSTKILNIVATGASSGAFVNFCSWIANHPSIKTPGDIKREIGEVWALCTAGLLFDPTRVYSMDNPEIDRVNIPGYFAALQMVNGPVYSSQTNHHLPNGKRYPLVEVEKFAMDLGVRQNVFTNSACYAFLHALFEGYGQIRLWGFDMASMPTPADFIATARRSLKPNWMDWYTYYRDGCMPIPGELGESQLCYLIGLATGKGFHITLPPNASLMQTYLPKDFRYGYSYRNAGKGELVP